LFFSGSFTQRVIAGASELLARPLCFLPFLPAGREAAYFFAAMGGAR